MPTPEALILVLSDVKDLTLFYLKSSIKDSSVAVISNYSKSSMLSESKSLAIYCSSILLYLPLTFRKFNFL